MKVHDQDRYEILNSLPIPVFVLKVGEDGVPRYAAYNTVCQRQSGKSCEDMLGKTVIEVYGFDIASPVLERHEHVAKTGKPLTYEWTAPVDDSVHQISTTLTPVFDQGGNLHEIVGTVRNITLDDSFGQAGLRSEALNNELEDFIGLAAHDLRTPMRNIEQLVDLIKEDFSDQGDGKLRLIEMLGGIASKSFALISDILNATTSLQATAEVSTFEIHALINDILLALRTQNLSSLEAPRGWMHGDKRVVQLTLHNLLDNALKHADLTDPALSIDIHNRPDNQVEITVCDNGKGFSDPAIAFLGGDQLRTGSGFGLFGIRRLIEKRGGSISATNRREGTGAKISVILPGSFHSENANKAVNM